MEYYNYVSVNIDSDAYFELMMSQAWNIESRNNPNSMPFAGSKAKVTAVNSREAYRNDHHRNLFGTDSKTPFDKKSQGFETTNLTNFSGKQGSQMPAAGDSKMAWLASSQRTSAVDYRGIQKSDDELTMAFRDKLAARGARGVLGMQRIFKVMDDNGSGTLDV